MGPEGRSGGCLAFAVATAKRKVVRLRQSESGTRRGGGCGGSIGLSDAWLPFVPGLKVVRCRGRRVAAAREVNTGEKLYARWDPTLSWIQDRDLTSHSEFCMWGVSKSDQHGKCDDGTDNAR